MKICKICGKNELEVEFYKGNSSVCKECVKERVYQNHLKREAEKAKLEGKEFHPRGHQLKCPTELVGKGYKYCNECKQWLPLSEFGYYYKKGNSNKTINSVCKKCAVIRTQRTKNRAQNIENSNAVSKARRELDPEYAQHIRDLDNKYRHSEKGMINTLYSGAKKRAALYGLEFNIEPSDIIIPEYCPILHMKLEIGKIGGSDNSPSLDRIDSTKGYIKRNIQVISKLANSMKNSANKQQLKTFSEYYISNEK